MKQFLSYSLVGLVSTLLDFILYTVLISYSPLSASNAKRFSFLLGTLNSFFFNKKITFKSRDKPFIELIKYLTVWSLSFLINSFSHDFSSFYLTGYMPFLIATSLSITINFLGAKFFVFKNN